MRWSCCAAPPKPETSEAEKFEQRSNIFPEQQPTSKPMLARIINELAGLPTDSEVESEEDLHDATPGSSPPHDPAHLSSMRRSSSQQYFSSQKQQQQRDRRSSIPTQPQPDRPGRWGTLLTGAKKLFDGIVDLESSRSPSPERHPPQHRHPGMSPPGATTQGYPTISPGSRQASESDVSLLGSTCEPSPLAPSSDHPLPNLSEPSALMQEHHIRSIVSEVPLRYRGATWKLAYSTQRDGISMQTMLRKARGKAPTVLVVRDMGKAVFGAFCSEPWHLSSRYFGTGETFVFQLAPREAVWHWWWRKAAAQQNDYFMWATQEAVAVGGAGGYALWLDADLANGISRNSITFGNDSLSSKEEFRIGAVELWWLD